MTTMTMLAVKLARISEKLWTWTITYLQMKMH